MENFIAILESQLARLGSIDTEFDNLTMIAIMIGTLKNIDELERLLISVSVIKGADHVWRQLSTSFDEKTKQLQKTSSTREQHDGMAHGRLAEISCRPLSKEKDSSKKKIGWHYCNKKRNVAKKYLTKKKYECRQPQSCGGDQKSGK